MLFRLFVHWFMQKWCFGLIEYPLRCRGSKTVWVNLIQTIFFA